MVLLQMFLFAFSIQGFTLNRASGVEGNVVCGLRELVDVSHTREESHQGEQKDDEDGDGDEDEDDDDDDEDEGKGVDDDYEESQ